MNATVSAGVIPVADGVAVEPAYYSVAEAARLLGVSRVTIWRWARVGRLPIWRLGHRTARVKRDDLERLLTLRGGREIESATGEAGGTVAHAGDAGAIAGLQQQSRALQAEIARRTAAEEQLTAALAAERAARATVERAQQRADFLSTASVTLAGSLLDESTLEWVARLAVPALADWCVVDLAEVDEDGQTRLRRIAAAHADPAREPLVHELQQQYPLLDSGATHTALRVLRSRRAWFDPAVSPERLEAEARDPAHHRISQALGFNAEMVIPLIARGRTLGTITLVCGDGRSFDADDVAVAEELARRCALAIASAQALTSEEAARRDAQRAAERTRRLQEITGQLSQSLQADDVLLSIARSAADLLQAPVGAVFLLDPDVPDNDFTLAVAHGIDAERASHVRLPRRASLAGRALDESRTLVVDDVSAEPSAALPALLTGQTTGSEIAAPITSGSDRLGVIKVFSPTIRRFTPDDADLLTALASAAAVALTNARLYLEAQVAIRTRDELLSAAAHDLKSPLTSVKGTAQLLRRHALQTGSERLVQGLARIDATATKMAQQLDELVDLTRVQMGEQLELLKYPIDLVDLARRVAAEMEEVSDQHQIRVETTQAALTGTWDGVRLGRVLENLLSNAIKYSPNSGEVIVRISQEEEHGRTTAVLAVSDQGLGVPAADLPLIFERFQRARNVVGRIGGTGIGLASARQIVEQHGGTISVSSVEGAGSTFTVRLPLR